MCKVHIPSLSSSLRFLTCPTRPEPRLRMTSTRRSGKKRRSSTKSTPANKKRQSSSTTDVVVATPTVRFCQLLELGFSCIWAYLPPSDIINLLDSFPRDLSGDFAYKITLKAIQALAVENNTHLGQKCGCDWMRNPHFFPISKSECTDSSPYLLDETLPILQVPGGPRAFLKALILTKKLMELVSSQDPNAATFAPVVCPLVSKKKNNLRLAECIESDAKRVLNEMYGKNGGRFFRVFTMKRGRRDQDFLDYHWDGIKGSSCKYCADPTRLKTQVVERIRLNCETVYRPLKAAMVKNLEFVRFVPQTGHCRLRKSENPYQGLIGGITEDGILCGAYLVEGLQTV